jgi:hypothetical protein
MILQEEMTLGQETRSSLHYCSLQFKNNFFKPLSSEKRSELKGILSVGPALNIHAKSFIKIWPYPVRSLKLVWQRREFLLFAYNNCIIQTRHQFRAASQLNFHTIY